MKVGIVSNDTCAKKVLDQTIGSRRIAPSRDENHRIQEVHSLGQDGSNSLAGTAPGGEAVEHDNLVVLEGLLPGVDTVRRGNERQQCVTQL